MNNMNNILRPSTRKTAMVSRVIICPKTRKRGLRLCWGSRVVSSSLLLEWSRGRQRTPTQLRAFLHGTLVGLDTNRRRDRPQLRRPREGTEQRRRALNDSPLHRVSRKQHRSCIVPILKLCCLAPRAPQSHRRRSGSSSRRARSSARARRTSVRPGVARRITR